MEKGKVNRGKKGTDKEMQLLGGSWLLMITDADGHCPLGNFLASAVKTRLIPTMFRGERKEN